MKDEEETRTAHLSSSASLIHPSSFILHPSLEGPAMTDNPRLRQLLDELHDSHATPEEVCRSCPELLPEVRARSRAERRSRPARPPSWWRRSPRPCRRRTSAASFTATSSLATCCSPPTARPRSAILGWPVGRKKRG